ncbi:MULTISPECIES: aldehyde ferredoxin oxidoreductase [Desulfitobacterium]|uniref:Aldehyde:ferredoxin oxidoreductase n=1 Tax=Desulfitobacterium dehalogenans (strain ATCC 51507 / DSM 9161 / JW/IU-DC1) TaxID=756499 RepID=I4A6P1_DESDJ|nr:MULTISPECIES: aldehyde ferredoxin oxidoreductase [Desulfitobacterium]AFL99625.1 aldehyde:ferredoxin oxidoreductase [Desulfitobacterium dehalogenans ATCC 51507]
MSVYGWAGKILRVNFTTGNINTEDTSKYKDYVGGMGIGYKVIYDEVPLETHAHDEASKIVMATGPLTATGVPCSGRMNITCLSSWSKGFSIVDGHMGGHFAHALKYAGYDAIIFEGKSAKPVYLKIDDDKVSIEDASHLWGKGTFEANRMLVKENGENFCAAVIGAAGENLVNMSNLITSFGNSGGAGCGAIFGSKKVKGIAVRGTGNIKIANVKDLREQSNYMLKELIGGNNNHNVPATPQSWAEYSAPSGKNRWSGASGLGWHKAPGGFVDMGEQPPGDLNKIGFRAHKGHFDHGDLADKYMVKVGGCSSCPIRCYAEYDVDPLADFDLPTKVSNTCMPIISVGNWYAGNIGKMKHVDENDGSFVNNVTGARAVDEYGLWDNYGNIQKDFAYCYKKGILKEKLPKEEYDSIPWELLESGDPRWIWEIVKRVASNKGEIATIGMGTYLMVEKWGLGKEYFDDQGQGNLCYNGYPNHHGPSEAGQAAMLYNLMYNRDCMVHHVTCITSSGSPYELYKGILEEEFGEGVIDPPKHYTPMNRSKAKFAKWAFIGKQWHDMATLCNWMYPMTLSPVKARGYKGDLELDAKYMTAVTGEKWTRADVDLASERVSNMLRVITALSYNIHLGSKNLRKDHDEITKWVFDKDPDFKAFEEGTDKLDRDDMEIARDMFYEEMGWDKETGIPTRKTLERLSLGYMADDLEKRGLLPA